MTERMRHFLNFHCLLTNARRTSHNTDQEIIAKIP